MGLKSLVDREADALNIATPAGLPDFVAFAAFQPSEQLPRIHAAEWEILGPGAVPKRRSEFARGRGAAHRALEALGRSGEPVLAGANREPLWPNGVVGSISHAAGFGVAIVAGADRTDGVGVDIEKLGDVSELEDQVLRPEERAWIGDLEVDQQPRAVLAIFSAKEAIFKAFFPRCRVLFGFETASLTPISTGYVATLLDGIDTAYPPNRTFAVSSSWYEDIVLSSVVLPKTP